MTQRTISTRVLALAVTLSLLGWGAATARAQSVSATFKVVCLADPTAQDLTHGKACLTRIPRLTFGGELTLAVEHAPEITFDDADEPRPADLVLVLDGKPLPGLHPAVGRSQTDEDDVTTTLLTFRIVRDLTTATARANWKEVLVAANTGRKLTVSTGLEDGAPSQSRVTAEFLVVRNNRLLGWALVAVVGLIAFFWVAARTGALRDKEPESAKVKEPTDRAFSLARVQMALWTMLTFYAYLYIWFLTGEYNATIPASVVALMGVSLTTFGTAAAIDASKVKTARAKLEKVEEQRALRSGDAALKKEEEDLRARTEVCKTEGPVSDIVTSAEGASLHRLQFILWTIALAVVFVVTVKRTLAMPDFDATLLSLMGLTSGTYAALKLPENKS